MATNDPIQSDLLPVILMTLFVCLLLGLALIKYEPLKTIVTGLLSDALKNAAQPVAASKAVPAAASAAASANSAGSAETAAAVAAAAASAASAAAAAAAAKETAASETAVLSKLIATLSQQVAALTAANDKTQKTVADVVTADSEEANKAKIRDLAQKGLEDTLESYIDENLRTTLSEMFQTLLPKFVKVEESTTTIPTKIPVASRLPFASSVTFHTKTVSGANHWQVKTLFDLPTDIKSKIMVTFALDSMSEDADNIVERTVEYILERDGTNTFSVKTSTGIVTSSKAVSDDKVFGTMSVRLITPQTTSEVAADKELLDVVTGCVSGGIKNWRAMVSKNIRDSADFKVLYDTALEKSILDMTAKQKLLGENNTAAFLADKQTDKAFLKLQTFVKFSVEKTLPPSSTEWDKDLTVQYFETVYTNQWSVYEAMTALASKIQQKENGVQISANSIAYDSALLNAERAKRAALNRIEEKYMLVQTAKANAKTVLDAALKDYDYKKAAVTTILPTDDVNATATKIAEMSAAHKVYVDALAKQKQVDTQYTTALAQRTTETTAVDAAYSAAQVKAGVDFGGEMSVGRNQYSISEWEEIRDEIYSQMTTRAGTVEYKNYNDSQWNTEIDSRRRLKIDAKAAFDIVAPTKSSKPSKYIAALLKYQAASCDYNAAVAAKETVANRQEKLVADVKARLEKLTVSMTNEAIKVRDAAIAPSGLVALAVGEKTPATTGKIGEASAAIKIAYDALTQGVDTWKDALSHLLAVEEVILQAAATSALYTVIRDLLINIRLFMYLSVPSTPVVVTTDMVDAIQTAANTIRDTGTGVDQALVDALVGVKAVTGATSSPATRGKLGEALDKAKTATAATAAAALDSFRLCTFTKTGTLDTIAGIQTIKPDIDNMMNILLVMSMTQPIYTDINAMFVSELIKVQTAMDASDNSNRPTPKAAFATAMGAFKSTPIVASATNTAITAAVEALSTETNNPMKDFATLINGRLTTTRDIDAMYDALIEYAASNAAYMVWSKAFDECNHNIEALKVSA
jgi:hypothetical protein